ncbi:hypothetical protein ACFYU8_18360 [Brevibacillus sp. NPDC003359]|uniref:hypothetical protein n=1 Tax=unclassified Brevibacillus TaxID=2684853 RepID=UPI0036A28FDC
MFVNEPGLYKGTYYRLMPDNKVAVYTSFFQWDGDSSGESNKTLSNSKAVVSRNEIDPQVIKECEENGFYEVAVKIDSSILQVLDVQ